MMKKAFVFPGQGAQKVGMVKDLYDAYPVVKQLFEEADDALGFSLTKLCFEGPDEELMKTYNTQPAILTASTACCRVLAQEGLTPDIAAGHSLGEYSALVAAGALTCADAALAADDGIDVLDVRLFVQRRFEIHRRLPRPARADSRHSQSLPIIFQANLRRRLPHRAARRLHLGHDC